MIWESLQGKVLRFWPEGTCPNGVSLTGTGLLGQVVSVTPLPPTERGNLPTASVLVQGRSGKQMTINFTETRARVFDTWRDALNDPNP